MSSLEVNAVPTIPMEASAHKIGCPAQRVEQYENTKPATSESPSKTVTVVRCADCGNQQTFEGDMARVARKLTTEGKANGRRNQGNEERSSGQGAERPA